MSTMWSTSLASSGRPACLPPPTSSESSRRLAEASRRLPPLLPALIERSAVTRHGQPYGARVCPYQSSTGLWTAHAIAAPCLGAQSRWGMLLEPYVRGFSVCLPCSSPPASLFESPEGRAPWPTRLRSTGLIPHAGARRIRHSSFLRLRYLKTLSVTNAI